MVVPGDRTGSGETKGISDVSKERIFGLPPVRHRAPVGKRPKSAEQGRAAPGVSLRS